jgi:hypothetical protein
MEDCRANPFWEGPDLGRTPQEKQVASGYFIHNVASSCLLMACCCSSPHAARRYPYPGDDDLDEEENAPLQLRTFGKYRPGSGVLVPDDIVGLPSTHIRRSLASDPSVMLYEAEVDQGRGCRGMRPMLCFLTVIALPFAVLYACIKSLVSSYGINCDESCQWIRKEYSTRAWYRVYSNRIESNAPVCRLFGMCGCGSWNGDNIVVNQFDRGAFGFRRVKVGVIHYLCCVWPLYGWAVARQVRSGKFSSFYVDGTSVLTMPKEMSV